MGGKGREDILILLSVVALPFFLAERDEDVEKGVAAAIRCG